MGEQEIVSKKQKGKKIAAYIINTISIIIMLFAVFIVITSLTSKDRGYTSYFGKAYVLVKSDSMAQDLTKPDNFKTGDVIVFRVLSDEQKLGLEEGTVITFWDNNISTSRELNTHRIYAVRDSDGDGVADEYSTKGDNNPIYDKGADAQQIWRKASDVQGVYVGKSAFVGHVLTYLQSSTGFAIFIVVPCVLVMIYCIVLVVLNLMRYTRAKTVIQHEDDVDALKAEIKAQLLKEMEEQNKAKGNQPTNDEAKKEEDQANDSAKEQNSDADATGEDK